MAVFSRSWSLFSSARQVLKTEKTFIFYPVLAAVVMLLLPIFIVSLTLFALIAAVNRTLVGIYRGAVYLYAAQAEVAPQFDRTMITPAFGPTK